MSFRLVTRSYPVTYQRKDFDAKLERYELDIEISEDNKLVRILNAERNDHLIYENELLGTQMCLPFMIIETHDGRFTFKMIDEEDHHGRDNKN